MLIYRFHIFYPCYKKQKLLNTLLRQISCKNRTSPVSFTVRQTKRLKLLSLSPVSLNKAFICSFYCFLFVSQYVIKAGLHSDTAVSLMSLPGPLTAAQYNISALRRYPHSPWIIQPCTAASRILFGKPVMRKAIKGLNGRWCWKQRGKKQDPILNRRH